MNRKPNLYQVAGQEREVTKKPVPGPEEQLFLNVAIEADVPVSNGTAPITLKYEVDEPAIVNMKTKEMVPIELPSLAGELTYEAEIVCGDPVMPDDLLQLIARHCGYAGKDVLGFVELHFHR